MVGDTALRTFTVCALLLAAILSPADSAAQRALPELPPFDEVEPPPAPDYGDLSSWAALPQRQDFADFTPAGMSDDQANAPADVFFLHPTTFLTPESWNAAIDHPQAAPRLDELVIKHQASVFNGCCRVYAPRYRQAGLAAFFGPEEEGRKARMLAYDDVKAAFRHYLENWNQDRPFIIASHSQGSYYALWLLQDIVDNDEALLERFVAAYIVGTSIPLDVYERTMERINPCRSISDTRCVLNWSTYLEGAEARRSKVEIRHRYQDGVWEPNQGKELQCTNPLMWTVGMTPEWAPASLNRGTLAGRLGTEPLPAVTPGEIAARCHDGVLYVKVPEDNHFADRHRNGNFHNQDYSLFYANIRDNAAARVEAHVRGAHLGMVIDLARIMPPNSFEDTPEPEAPDYANPMSWGALPWRLDFADFAPEGEQDRQHEAQVDVFFLYPTTFLFDEGWNSPIDHAVATARVDQGVLKHQASVFNGSCRVFAPRYRQSTLVAFFPQSGTNGARSLDLSYGDVRRAFEYYIAEYNQGRPFILASHSQGTRHLIQLLGDVVASHPARERLIAVYAIGYPLPLRLYETEYEGLEPCRTEDDLGCIVSWGIWGEGGPDPLNRPKGLQCTNPLSWAPDGEPTPAGANRGSLVGSILHDPLPAPIPGTIGAQCRGGVLWASVPEDSYYYESRQPPNNYHNLDYSLFYLNLRDNVRVRTEAYLSRE
jgi:hypothetical protein